MPAAPVTIPAASKVLLATFTLSTALLDETILRVVGGVGVGSDQTAANENQIGAIGMCLATETAVAAGIASLPDPVTDIADDIWFFYQGWGTHFTQFSAIATQANTFQYHAFDSKAKRIIQKGMSVVLVGANASATEGLLCLPFLRMLTQVRGTR